MPPETSSPSRIAGADVPFGVSVKPFASKLFSGRYGGNAGCADADPVDHSLQLQPSVLSHHQLSADFHADCQEDELHDLCAMEPLNNQRNGDCEKGKEQDASFGCMLKSNVHIIHTKRNVNIGGTSRHRFHTSHSMRLCPTTPSSSCRLSCSGGSLRQGLPTACLPSLPRLRMESLVGSPARGPKVSCNFSFDALLRLSSPIKWSAAGNDASVTPTWKSLSLAVRFVSIPDCPTLCRRSSSFTNEFLHMARRAV